MREHPGYDSHATARWQAEPPKRAQGAAPYQRGPFVRDRARVLHSSALRRLAAKTQVIEVGAGDFPRTRLTHSLECAQIGRELGAALGCDPDLADAACLAGAMDMLADQRCTGCTPYGGFTPGTGFDCASTSAK